MSMLAKGTSDVGLSQLHTAEHPWVPCWKKRMQNGGLSTCDMSNSSFTLGLLNKLTFTNFDVLKMEFASLCSIAFKERNAADEYVIMVLIDKASLESRYCALYAQLCGFVVKRQLESSKANRSIFRDFLLLKCQLRFETDKSKSHRLQPQEVLNQNKERQRTIGNVRFIGELYMQKMLTPRIVLACIHTLSLRSPEEESLECLCNLLLIVGRSLHYLNIHQDYVKQVLNELSQTAEKPGVVVSRIKFLIKDVMEMQHNHWIPRKTNSGPKTIQQIHEDSRIEFQNTAVTLAELNPQGKQYTSWSTNCTGTNGWSYSQQDPKVPVKPLPAEIWSSILGELGTCQRLRLRAVCVYFRDVVDDAPFTVDQVAMEIELNDLGIPSCCRRTILKRIFEGYGAKITHLKLMMISDTTSLTDVDVMKIISETCPNIVELEIREYDFKNKLCEDQTTGEGLRNGLFPMKYFLKFPHLVVLSACLVACFLGNDDYFYVANFPKLDEIEVVEIESLSLAKTILSSESYMAWEDKIKGVSFKEKYVMQMKELCFVGPGRSVESILGLDPSKLNKLYLDIHLICVDKSEGTAFSRALLQFRHICEFGLKLHCFSNGFPNFSFLKKFSNLRNLCLEFLEVDNYDDDDDDDSDEVDSANEISFTNHIENSLVYLPEIASLKHLRLTCASVTEKMLDAIGCRGFALELLDLSFYDGPLESLKNLVFSCESTLRILHISAKGELLNWFENNFKSLRVLHVLDDSCESDVVEMIERRQAFGNIGGKYEHLLVVVGEKSLEVPKIVCDYRSGAKICTVADNRLDSDELDYMGYDSYDDSAGNLSYHEWDTDSDDFNE